MTTTDPAVYNWVGKPRPTSGHEEVQKIVALQLLPAVMAWLKNGGDTDPDEDDVLSDLSDNFDSDGYQFARNLDSDGWSPDAELVDVLSGASLYQAQAQCVKAWMEQNNITAKLAVGAKVMLTPQFISWSTSRRGETVEAMLGEVTEVRDGSYSVFVAGLGHVREGVGTHALVIPWEKLEAMPAT